MTGNLEDDELAGKKILIFPIIIFEWLIVYLCKPSIDLPGLFTQVLILPFALPALVFVNILGIIFGVRLFKNHKIFSIILIASSVFSFPMISPFIKIGR